MSAGITVTIATHRGTETRTLEDARPETLERVASWLASGWRVDVSMQLNAGPILEHGERSGRFGVCGAHPSHARGAQVES